ncbi:Ycf48-like protein precursor [compost metagenome]|uniref:Ycf48-like protein n=1 Tax=Pseudomonas fluorescens TaxID=294 RepID=A0A5E7RMT7_PSEFL|nr:YCF48-related protein [Pseudomonas fluorescens]VVP74980.1 Ycf48-like protein [Pseudomonas fluorescens]
MARRLKNKSLYCNGLAGVLLMAICVSPGVAAQFPDVIDQRSVLSTQASHATLLSIARAGERLVAVGERGVVVLSDDSGRTWRQVQVPVSSTLTAVQFVNSRQGWAVGHSGVILHSGDAGQSWTLQLDGRRAAQQELNDAQTAALEPNADEGAQRRLVAAQRLVTDGPDKPFLALSFSDTMHGLAVGAYGLVMRTEDGGMTWQSWMGRIPNIQGLHLYAVAQAGDRYYLAGEQGLLIRSLDGGKSFEKLDSPYEGTYFSLALDSDGAVLIGGLRGNVFRSRDQGNNFEAMNNPVPVSLGSAIRIGQQVLWVNQAGGVLRSTGDSSTLQPLATPAAPALTAVVDAPDGSLVGVGFAGTARLAISNVNATSSNPERAVAE